jgi:hypothetical protein
VLVEGLIDESDDNARLSNTSVPKKNYFRFINTLIHSFVIYFESETDLMRSGREIKKKKGMRKK